MGNVQKRIPFFFTGKTAYGSLHLARKAEQVLGIGQTTQKQRENFIKKYKVKIIDRYERIN